MRRKTSRWLALMGGLAIMTASLGVAGGAQAATHAARPAAIASSVNCTSGDFTIDANMANLPALFSTGSTLGFSTQTSGDLFCTTSQLPTAVYDVTPGVASGSCLALNSTTGLIYLHNPSGCGGPASYLLWETKFNSNTQLWEFQNQYAPAGDPCLYDLNGAAKYAACNGNSRADTFTLG